MENRIAGVDKPKEITPIEWMNAAIASLYLNLPEEVAKDVKEKWESAYVYLTEKPYQQPIPVQEGLREREIAYKMLLGYYENTDGKFPDKETYDNFWDESPVHPEKKEK